MLDIAVARQGVMIEFTDCIFGFLHIKLFKKNPVIPLFFWATISLDKYLGELARNGARP